MAYTSSYADQHKADVPKGFMPDDSHLAWLGSQPRDTIEPKPQIVQPVAAKLDAGEDATGGLQTPVAMKPTGDRPTVADQKALTADLQETGPKFDPKKFRFDV